MQKKLIAACIAAFGLMVGTAHAQTFQICENSTVVFELEDNYWGEVLWEYSTDSLAWESLETNPIESFTATIDATGYYRLRVFDAECDSSYVSQINHIVVNAEPDVSFTLHTTFLGGAIPSSANPFLWVQSDVEISEVSFHLPDTVYTTDEAHAIITNPGVDFAVYATALDSLTGCTIYSDTLSFIVEQSDINANVFFNIQGNFDLNSVILQSNIDSIPLEGNVNTTISYDQSLGLAFIYAYTMSDAGEAQIVGILVVEPNTGFLELNNEETAFALIAIQPEISSLIFDDFENLSTQILEHESFPQLLEAVEYQIETNGYLNFDDEALLDWINQITDDVIVNSETGLIGDDEDSFRSSGDFPMLTPHPNGNLSYHHNDTWPIYFRRSYLNENPISDSNICRVNPAAFDVYSSTIQTLLNIALSALPQLAQHIANLQELGNSANEDAITAALLQDDSDYSEFSTRIVNGFNLESDDEAVDALALNSIIITIKMKLSLAAGGLGLIGQAAESIGLTLDMFNLVTSIIEGTAGDWSPGLIAESVLALGGIVALYVGTGPLGWILLGVTIGSALIHTTQVMIKFFESTNHIRYTNTKIGDVVTGKLAFESNSNDTFISVPGGKTSIHPQFYVNQRALVYRKPFLSNDLELLHEGIPNFYLHADELSIDAVSTNTASLGFMGSEAFDFGNFNGQPLSAYENDLDWRIAYDAQPGSESLLSLSLKYGDTPITIEGLDPQGQWTYTATVEEPLLEPVGNTDLFGAMDAYLEQPPKVRVIGATSSLAYNDIPLRWTVTEGGGVIRKTAPFDDTEASEIDHLTYTDTDMEQDGICAMDWKLGEEGEQALQVGLLNPETEAVSNLLTFNAGNICGDPFPATTIQGAYIVLPDSSGISLQWYPHENSTFCELEYYVMNSDDVQTVFVNESPLSPYILSENQLYPDTTYYWRLRCGCSEDPLIAGPWSDWVDFNSQEIGTLGPQPEYPPATIHCLPGGAPTEVVEVTHPDNGSIWMDRNLGASQAATASNDPASYGDLYQWGRFSDGHQCRNSETTSTNATTAAPNQGNSWDGKFILEHSSPWDWLSSQNNNLWQGVNGINNPCPEGYRIPSEAEWLTWGITNSSTAFNSELQLPAAGARNRSSGSLFNVGSLGFYWSSAVSGTSARRLYFYSSVAGVDGDGRARGFSVRCLKD